MPVREEENTSATFYPIKAPPDVAVAGRLTQRPAAAPSHFPYRHRTIAEINNGYELCPSCGAKTKWPCSSVICPMVTDPVDIAVRRRFLQLHTDKRQHPLVRSGGAKLLGQAMQAEAERIDRHDA